MGRKSMISIDYSNLEQYAERLEQLGADLQAIFTTALQKAAEKVQADTVAAMADVNLPAGGAYHGKNRDTEAAIITDTNPNWQGSVGEISLGFDKTKPGAGGFLITGTPKMRPDPALEKIYGRKTYEKQINKIIEKELQDEITRRLGG